MALALWPHTTQKIQRCVLKKLLIERRKMQDTLKLAEY